MRIGLKYCGGCNPRYDRKKFLDQVSQKLGKSYNFVVAKEGEVYDFLLVVGGCTNCCANFENIETRNGVFCIKREGDYEKVISVIQNID